MPKKSYHRQISKYLLIADHYHCGASVHKKRQLAHLLQPQPIEVLYNRVDISVVHVSSVTPIFMFIPDSLHSFVNDVDLVSKLGKYAQNIHD